MNDDELIKALSATGKSRVTLYLSPAKVESVYLQSVAQVTELVRSGKHGGKLSGSLLGFLGAEVAAEGALEAKVAMTPLLQAIAAEKAAEQAGPLIDLTRQAPTQGRLMRYIGPARFHLTTPPAESEKPPLSQAAWDIITQRRLVQEEIIRWKNKDAKTVVLAFTQGPMVFASIASSESLNENLFASYFREPVVGILCRMEGAAQQAVTFLDPIWIWHEAP